MGTPKSRSSYLGGHSSKRWPERNNVALPELSRCAAQASDSLQSPECSSAALPKQSTLCCPYSEQKAGLRKTL